MSATHRALIERQEAGEELDYVFFWQPVPVEAATDPSRWRGANLLGFVLMDVREHLREG